MIPGLNATKNAACTIVNGVKNCSVATYQFVKPVVGPTTGVVQNVTSSGWNLIKPITGHALNFSVSGWNFVAPKIGGVVGGVLNQVGRFWNATANLVSEKLFPDFNFDYNDEDVIHVDFSQEEWETELIRVIDQIINEDREVDPNAFPDLPKGGMEGWTRKEIVEY